MQQIIKQLTKYCFELLSEVRIVANKTKAGRTRLRNKLEYNTAGTLVAVVATYNRLDKLRLTMARLLDNPPRHLDRLIVVDNACTDGTTEWLKNQNDPRIMVIHCDENLGGAGGFEAGMRYASEKIDPDWIVVMDDDAYPAINALQQFHSQPRDQDKAVAAAVYYPDGKICEMNRPSINPFWRPKVFINTVLGALTGRGRDCYHIPYDTYEATVPIEIDLSSFVGLFVSRKMIAKVGLPDGGLFLYGDDVIYTLRLRRNGFAIQFEPELRFEHACSTFASDAQRVFNPLWKVYYAYRNGLIMYRNAAGLMFWPLLLLVLPKWLLATRRYGEKRAIYLQMLRLAVWHGIRGRTDTDHDEILALARKRPQIGKIDTNLGSSCLELSCDAAQAATLPNPK